MAFLWASFVQVFQPLSTAEYVICTPYAALEVQLIKTASRLEHDCIFVDFAVTQLENVAVNAGLPLEATRQRVQ